MYTVVPACLAAAHLEDSMELVDVMVLMRQESPLLPPYCSG